MLAALADEKTNNASAVGIVLQTAWKKKTEEYGSTEAVTLQMTRRWNQKGGRDDNAKGG